MVRDIIRFGVIGTGGQANSVHIGGIKRCPWAELIAICDTNEALLQQRAQEHGIPADRCYRDYAQLLARDDIDAVTIGTPNNMHAPIVIAAAKMGKHVMCEKPIARSAAEAQMMLAACRAAGVRHMTAFTYRFVPAVRFATHLVRSGDIGEVRTLRSRRLQDWGLRAIGWRQVKALAGTGEIGDMMAHRLDYTQAMVGPIVRVSGLLRNFIPERFGPDDQMQVQDVDDWASAIVEFSTGAVGVFESSKVCWGMGFYASSPDDLDVHGADGTIVYRMQTPHVLRIGRQGGSLEEVPVPEEYLQPVGGVPGPVDGDPLQTFRYNEIFEFVDAVRHERDCIPSLVDGARTQAVVDAIVQSSDERHWVDVATVS
ncbi:MAG: Gfo/Idh/MocA family oxidoreductase [Chloroflexi bacterium]|nr:Gfo/Idh/MocA family oxidoreductase [Chloroflexota bacterium]